MSCRVGWTQRSRRYGVERGDTGLGRDAYGPPRHERDRRGYGPGPYPSDDGYPAEDDDAAGPGRQAEDDEFGQLLRRPGEMPPRQPRIRQPGRPQPGRYSPSAPPNGSAGHAGMPGPGMPGGGLPGSGGPGSGVPHGPAPHGGPAGKRRVAPRSPTARPLRRSPWDRPARDQTASTSPTERPQMPPAIRSPCRSGPAVCRCRAPG